ncbi:SCO2322 family protein [Streptomyces sp. NPDC101118]|uniref:SCO2322 family protein n=1 Tax=Streptomyces sp. NPDC101118 TaxID=3366109 RepID=UPI00381119CF
MPAAGTVLALLLALGGVFTLLGAGPAVAAGYRYWSFWEGTDGSWTYASQGPSTARPADGSVQGFRFAVSKDAPDAARPRAAADFRAVCGSTPAAAGKKRVALVIDFGMPADAPAGETPPRAEPRTACASVAPEATTAEALAAVAKPLRYNSAALLCAISGYPREGCGEQIAVPEENGTAAPTATPTAPARSSGTDGTTGSGTSVNLLIGLAAVLALGAAAVWKSRTRNR